MSITQSGMEWEKFTSAEDLAHEIKCGYEVLIWDGCGYHIDYVDHESEFGTYFMGNETQPEFYCKLVIPE